MSEEGAVLACHTFDTWNTHLQQANQIKKLVVVDFTASWCGPCRFISPVFAELSKKFTDVAFLKVDVDELKCVAQEYAVEAMPTFIIMREGTIVDRVVGARKDELISKITQHATSS